MVLRFCSSFLLFFGAENLHGMANLYPPVKGPTHNFTSAGEPFNYYSYLPTFLLQCVFFNDTVIMYIVLYVTLEGA